MAVFSGGFVCVSCLPLRLRVRLFAELSIVCMFVPAPVCRSVSECDVCVALVCVSVSVVLVLFEFSRSVTCVFFLMCFVSFGELPFFNQPMFVFSGLFLLL